MRRLSLGLTGIVAAWLLLDLWRLWTPSLITLFGRAAETPPEVMGLYALAVMAAPLLIVVWFRHGAPRVAAALVAAAFVVRLVLRMNPSGGDVQLYGSSLGVVLAVAALCLSAGTLGRALVPSVLTGVAAATAVHAMLGGFGAVWRGDGFDITVLLVQAVLVVAVVTLALRPVPAPTASAPTRTALLLLPVLLLLLLALVNVGRASTIDATWGPVVVVAGAGAAAAVAALPAPRRRPWLAAVLFTGSMALSLLPEVTGAPASGGLTPWALVAIAVGPSAAARMLLYARPGRSARGAAVATGAGAVLWTVLFFAYYAGYDLGYRADAVLVAVTALLAAAMLASRGADRRDTTATQASERRMDESGARTVAGLATATAAACVLALILPTVTVPTVATGDVDADDALTVAAYNVRMGYGEDGTFDPEAVAAQIRASGAEVVLLSEVDRGWLLNGGQDQLTVLARMLGMQAVFGPAADQIWGDAILTSLPVSEVSKTRYPMFDALTGAGITAATVTWHDQPVRILSTHLQPDGNAENATDRQAALFAEALAGVEGAVIGGGDLNTTRGSTAWRVLTASGAQDAFADASDRADIDHLLVSGLSVHTTAVVESPLSDHPMLIAAFR